MIAKIGGIFFGIWVVFSVARVLVEYVLRRVLTELARVLKVGYVRARVIEYLLGSIPTCVASFFKLENEAKFAKIVLTTRGAYFREDWHFARR